jgi:hypothetical protein
MHKNGASEFQIFVMRQQGFVAVLQAVVGAGGLELSIWLFLFVK